MLIYFNIFIITLIILFLFFGISFYLRMRKLEKQLNEEVKEEIAIIEKEKQIKPIQEVDIIEKYGIFEENQEIHKEELENDEFEEVRD